LLQKQDSKDTVPEKTSARNHRVVDALEIGTAPENDNDESFGTAWERIGDESMTGLCSVFVRHNMLWFPGRVRQNTESIEFCCTETQV